MDQGIVMVKENNVEQVDGLINDIGSELKRFEVISEDALKEQVSIF
ncbi:hypothetical protein [Cytobacillus gottheilii]|nr:hypothetical protein [Cytobacillus gottheilii]